ncbi:MAG: SPFH domain-containing protein [Defluviitaleaceae bacterium]|nr:SPFH domain-containing protein [Defluviitaleaceae bacterium]
MGDLSGFVGGGLILVIIFAAFFVILALWKRVPQSKAAVITGFRKKRVISGGGGLVIPILERYDIISLENIKVIVNIDGAISEQGVPVSVKTVAIVKVKSDNESIFTAMEQFYRGSVSKTTDVIAEQTEYVLLGKLREIIAKMTVEDLNKDKDKFITNVQGNAALDLAGMGLEIKAFTVKDISDDNGYLEALGRKQIADVKRQADIAEAEARRDTTISVAEAERKGEEARLLAATQVAEASKEKELKIQAFRKEEQTAKAIADNAYIIEENKVKKEVTETELQVELFRTQRETEVAQQEALRKEQELVATINKQADAALYQQTKDAEAAKVREVAKAEADARRVELEGNAAAAATRAKGQAEAEAIRATGLAEAEAIEAKGLAEAKAMHEKAEAFKQYNDAAVTQMIIEQLPAIAKNIAEPIGNVDRIVAIDGSSNGNGGANKVSGYVTDIMAQLPETVEALTGLDLKDMVKGFVSANNAAATAPTAAKAEKVEDK